MLWLFTSSISGDTLNSPFSSFQCKNPSICSFSQNGWRLPPHTENKQRVVITQAHRGHYFYVVYHLTDDITCPLTLVCPCWFMSLHTDCNLWISCSAIVSQSQSLMWKMPTFQLDIHWTLDSEPILNLVKVILLQVALTTSV